VGAERLFRWRRDDDGSADAAGRSSCAESAADRNYVDNGLAVKADLVNGMVPPGELGRGWRILPPV